MTFFHHGRAALIPATVAALGIGGCTPVAAPVEKSPPNVTVEHPEVRELTDFDEYNGWTAASASVDIRARVRGHIDKVEFTDGQIVQEGDMLFVLDPRPFQNELDRATEQVKIYEAQLEVAANEERREKELLKNNARTQRDVELAEAKRKSFEAHTSAAREEINRRKLELSYSRIAAPIAGKVGKAELMKGDLVNAGGSDPVLTTIVAIDPIHVYFSVDEPSLLRYRQRRLKSKEERMQPVEEAKIPFQFGLDTDEGYPHSGFLDFTQNKIDSSTGTIEVRGETPNADAQFIPGGRARVRVPVSDPYQALLVPDTAILSDLNKKYLLCLNDKNKVIRKDVKLGRLLDDGMRVILPDEEGKMTVTADDWVIVNGLQRARINDPVTPVDEEGNPVKTTGG